VYHTTHNTRRKEEEKEGGREGYKREGEREELVQFSFSHLLFNRGTTSTQKSRIRKQQFDHWH
jgi:hypothetical protein